jgi:hypothetical protein
MVVKKMLQKNVVTFSDEAEDIIKNGSQEVRTFKAIPTEGIKKEDLEVDII